MSLEERGLGPRPAGPRRRREQWALDTVVTVLVPIVALGLGLALTVAPVPAMVTPVAAAVVVLVWRRPPVAAYLLCALTPLIVGIDRGRFIPLLRPNEALLLGVGGPLLVRALLRWPSGKVVAARPSALLSTLLAMATCNSGVLILWNLVRGQVPSQDDVMYALVLWKLLAVYAVVRATIRTEAQVRRCLQLFVGAGVAVALIAILQSLGLFGVPHLLATFYAPYGHVTVLDNNRGSSTLALPAATADVMMFDLAIVLGMMMKGVGHRGLLAGMAGLFVIGTLASGQFSGAIGLIVAMVAIAVVARRPGLLLLLPIVGAVAGFVMRPVIEHRLQGFQTVSGLPESWVGRLHNLRSYFWPRVFADHNWLLGVRPDAHVPGPHAIGIKWVWIESGYTWLLWGGGLPLLLAYVAFLVLGSSHGWRLSTAARSHGVVGGTLFVVLIVQTVLMLFDPHITYRGSADLLFALVALSQLQPTPPPAGERS